jgi:hypothetical protein
MYRVVFTEAQYQQWYGVDGIRSVSWMSEDDRLFIEDNMTPTEVAECEPPPEPF